MLKFALPGILLLLFLGACGTSVTSDNTNDETDPVSLATIPADYPEDTVLEGQVSYSVFCVACHGPDAQGIEGLGKSLMESEFFHTYTDEETLAFIIEGRSVTHPDNTSGVAMPARGGYPSLGDDQIMTIIAYLRTEANALREASS